MERETTRRIFQVEKREISYIRYTLESYDGMAGVSTLDPDRAVIEVRIAPGCEMDVQELLGSLRWREGLLLEELTGPVNRPEKPHGGEGADAFAARKGFYIVTMGCQMNVSDSETVARMLVRAGWQPVQDPALARLILINTCSVRQKPEHKAVSMLGRMAALKQRRPGMILGIMGCFAQQKGQALLDRFPSLNLIMGPRALGAFPDILTRLQNQPSKPVLALGTSEFPMEATPRNATGRRVSAYIAVMQGCDNFCTYCIVPYVRGRERSRDPGEIILEARAQLASGVKEITLLGQNVNSYRWEGGDIGNFAELLHAVGRLSGLERLRFTTSHPKDLSDALIACFADLPALAPHIHLPFQAGSDAVLKRMGRGYTREDYFKLIEKLRKTQPAIALSSDVMVGFPGETDSDFQMTLDLIRRVEFDSLYSFKYSDRPGTAAAAFDGKLPEEVKTERLEALQSAQKGITIQHNRALVGSVVEVMVEGESRRGHQLTGRTGTNKIVNFKNECYGIGDIVKVLVKEALVNSLRGEALSLHA